MNIISNNLEKRTLFSKAVILELYDIQTSLDVQYSALGLLAIFSPGVAGTSRGHWRQLAHAQKSGCPIEKILQSIDTKMDPPI